MFRLAGAVAIAAATLMWQSCGTSDNGAGGSGSSGTQQVLLTPADSINAMMNEAMERLRLGDKSYLFDLEFEYLQDDITYDDYLNMAQIKWASADTITHVEIRDVELFDHDSALVDVTLHFEGVTGKKSYHRDKTVVYYHRGRWIKPTVSVIDMQAAYDEKIRVADSAAKAEAGG
jgi:hypothetical protein